MDDGYAASPRRLYFPGSDAARAANPDVLQAVRSFMLAGRLETTVKTKFASQMACFTTKTETTRRRTKRGDRYTTVRYYHHTWY